MRILLFLFAVLISEISFCQVVWKNVGNPFPPDGNVPLGLGVFNGDLYVAGDFGYAYGMDVGGIARWDGQTWYSLGIGVTGIGASPKCFGVFNNELYVGGEFTEMDSIPNTKFLARWNGTNWSSVTNNKDFDGGIRAINYKDDLYIGGDFWTLTGVTKSKCIVRYDGSNFYSVQGGVNGQYPTILSMAVYKDELYAAGIFHYANDTNLIVNNIARWDGISWKTLGSGVNSTVGSLVVDSVKNILYVVGSFTQAGGVAVKNIAAWDGITWSALPEPPAAAVGKMTMYRNLLFMGGYSTSVNDSAISYYDGQSWHPVIGPCCGPITALQVYNDELYVAGGFDKIFADSIIYIARLWMPVGVEEERKKNEEGKIKIYPNPNNGIIKLEIIQFENLKNAGVAIYDMTGKLVKKLEIISPKIEVETKEWAKGTYFLSLISDGKKIDTEKVVIE